MQKKKTKKSKPSKLLDQELRDYYKAHSSFSSKGKFKWVQMIFPKPNQAIKCKIANSQNWDDLVALFSESKECGDCWCMNHRLPLDKTITGNRAKTELKNLIAQKAANGVLAYSGNQCVGWCAIDPIKNQPGHDYFVKAKKSLNGIWSIHCLYIAPDFRSKGISKLLIQHAIQLAKEKNAKKILAFPIPEETRNKYPCHDAEFSGRFSTYSKLGFKKEERLNDFYQVVSLSL